MVDDIHLEPNEISAVNQVDAMISSIGAVDFDFSF